MARITLFNFDIGDGIHYKTIWVDDSDPTDILFSRDYVYAPAQPQYPTYADGDNVGSGICTGTTYNTYRYQSFEPYAYVTQVFNSTFCGYIPPVCDLTESSITHTDETAESANNGSINTFFTSSNTPITYHLTGPLDATNTIGYFTGLPPGDYIMYITDAIGCNKQVPITVMKFNAALTNYKYRLHFFTVKEKLEYELRFLYQKGQFDPAIYPKDLTGTDTPIIKKTTNSDEDKTVAFCPSSLSINVLANSILDPKEFANSQERDWQIELYKKPQGFTGTGIFNFSLTENTSPYVDGNIRLTINGVNVYEQVSSGSGGFYIAPTGAAFVIRFYSEIMSTSPDPLFTTLVKKNGYSVYNRTIFATPGTYVEYDGIVAENGVYELNGFTTDGGVSVAPIRITDNGNFVLDWQGWLLPDELQDFYADPKYEIELTATDGLLSLKGSTFGDPSLTFTDTFGNTSLLELFGLRHWVYLVKICLDQLGYDYGNTTILSSLCYQNYKGGDQWLNYATWSDLFYDADGIPVDTYSALEILLKGFKLQIFQYKGSFVLWDINDAYYLNAPAQAEKFTESLISLEDGFTVANHGTPPSNMLIGVNQANKPINPLQSLNYDKAFNQLEAKVDFNLLSLLFTNPSFELNAVQGDLPYLMTQTAGMNAFCNYDPQDPLDPTVGAYAGSWEMRTVGQSHVLTTGDPHIPVVQANGTIFFERDGFKAVHAIDDIIIDQTNKKLNISFYWRPKYYSDLENAIPRISVFYTDNTTGLTYIYSLTDKTGVGGGGWFLPSHSFPFAPIRQIITDYVAWNNYSFSTDYFPDTAIGHVSVYIGTPLNTRALDNPMTEDQTIDYDALTITQSDANDAYNFQTGEKHTVTNVTTYAKAEKKTIDLALFSYPNNRRTSGNVTYGDDYLTSLISNEWYFQLSVEQKPDRLPANVTKRHAKNYQRPMYKWQGDFFGDGINFYMVFTLTGITKVFVPFTIEHDLRNSRGNLVLIETDDTQMQSIYLYTPIYEKSARNNLS